MFTRMSKPYPAWVLALLVDSMLPTGGFVLSHGLETMVQEGSVTNGDEVGAVLGLFAHQVAGTELVAFWHVMKSPDLVPAVIRSGRRLDALVIPEETRNASIWQGQRLLDIARRLGSHAVPSVKPYAGPAMAMIARDWDLDPWAAASALLYRQVSEMASAAIRLLRIDGLEVFGKLFQVQAVVPDLVGAAKDRPLAAMATSVPWLEFMAMRHQHQTMRLFRT